MIQKKTLTRIRILNWMYFSNETISLTDGTGNTSALITGNNGAGKSTILDAMQMVLTGNTKRFNEAANEKSKRDLRGYVRCKVNTTNETYMRKGAVISNIALEFYEEKEKRHFVCGVHLLSADESDEVKRKWYIEEGSLDDISFLTDEKKPSLPEQFRNSGNKIQFYNANEYKDRLRHRLGNLEDKFFDVLRKTIAFRPVDDVKEFINKYVLSEKEIDVNSLRESIEALNELEHTLEKTKLERNALSEIISLSERIENNVHDTQVIELLILLANYDGETKKIDDLKRKISVNSESFRQKESEIELLEIQIDRADEKLAELRQAQKENKYSSLIEKLEKSLLELKREENESKRNRENLNQQVVSLKSLLALFEKIEKLPVSVQDIQDFLALKDDKEKFATLEVIKSFIEAQMSGLYEKLVHAQDEEKQIREELRKNEQLIKNLESQNFPFKTETEEFRSAIKNEFAARGIQSNVYILSELLEISDKTWTNAIEGFLSEKRFFIVVEPKYYDIASEVLVRSKKIYEHGIIDTKNLMNVEVQEKSLARFVESENSFAKKYIDYILGNVICCADNSELQNCECGITKDCVLYEDFAITRLNPEIYQKPFIGKNAIEVQLKTARKSGAELKIKLPELQNRIFFYKKIESCKNMVNFDLLKQTIPSVNRLENIQEQITLDENSLAKIKKNPELLELVQQIESQEKNRASLIADERKTEAEKAKLEISIQSETESVEEKEKQLSSLKENLDIVSIEKVSEYTEAKEKYGVESKTKSAETITTNFSPRLVTLQNQYKEMEKNLIQKQSDYDSKFIRDFKIGVENIAEYRDVFKKIDGVEIVKYEEKIRQAKVDSEEIFRNEFLSKMKEAIESSQYEFNNLRKALKNLSYGEDSYDFKISANKEKQSLYKMIMAEDNQGTDTLFSGGFEEKYKDEIEDLFSKLQVKENSESIVREYTDYRNYLDYDIEIFKKDGSVQRLSDTVHLNSGGESQVPFYVIMAASLNNIYKNGNCVRIMLMDEAFDRMDEQRIASTMDLFNALDFQVILFAPSQKIQDIGEKVSTVLTVIRDGRTSFVEDFRFWE